METVDTWADLLERVEGWYDYLDARDGSGAHTKEGDVPDEEWGLPAAPDLASEVDEGNLGRLNSLIGIWEDTIARSLGYTWFQGHGSYGVSPSSEMGLRLTVTVEDDRPPSQSQ